jgi:hypothetical protein
LAKLYRVQMLQNRFRFFRFLLAQTLLLLLSSVGSAQNYLVPNWVDNGWSNLHNPPQFCGAGNRVLVWNSNATSGNPGNDCISVYNVANRSLAARLNIQGYGNITSACLNYTGTSIFYATDQGAVYDYSIGSLSQTALNITEAVNNGARLMTASKDGNTLAYVVTTPGASTDEICLYNLATNAAITRFSLKNPSTQTTASLSFANNSSNVVVSGPTLFDFTGKQIASDAGGGAVVAVNPAQTQAFTYQTDGKIHGYNLSGLTPTWTSAPPTATGVYYYPQSDLSVSSDGNSILFGGTNYGASWYVASLSASSGQQLSASMVVPVTMNGAYNSPFVVCAPNVNQALIGPAGPDSYGYSWSFSSSTGSGTFLSQLFGGVTVDDTGQGAPFITNLAVTSGSVTTPAIACDNAYTGGNSRTILNASTGAVIAVLPSEFAIPSPDGKFYATTSTTQLSVYSVASYSEIATLTLPKSLVGWDIVWGTTSRLFVTDGTSVYSISFSGSSLALVKTFVSDSGSFRVSPDGTKVALFNGGCTVCDAVLGAVLYQIAADPKTYGGIVDISFSSTGLIGVSEVTEPTGGSFFNQFRTYNITGTTPTLLSKISYQLLGDRTYTSAAYPYIGGDLSLDGLSVVMGSYVGSTATNPRQGGTVRVYSVSTGTLLTEWNNQWIPDLSQYNSSSATILNGGSAFAFSADSKTIFWNSGGALVAAPLSPLQLTLSFSPSSVPGGTASTGTITLTPAPATVTTVTLTSASASAVVPATVSIPANAGSATFSVSTNGVTTSTSAAITAAVSNTQTTGSLTVTPPSGLTVSFSPSTVNAGTSSTGTVTLNASAGPGGLVVALSSANTTAVSVPASVTVPANGTSVTFTATTGQPAVSGPVSVTATAGTVTGSAPLTVNRTVTVEASFNQTSVTGGTAVLLTVTLSAPAPAGGTTLTITSSNSALQPRTTITVPAGATSASLGVATNPVLTNTATVLTVTNPTGQSGSANEQVLAPVIQSVTPGATALIGGAPTYALIQLSGPAPANFSIACSSNNAAVTLPATFAFPTGHVGSEVTLTTTAVTAVTAVTITIGGKTFTLTLYP